MKAGCSDSKPTKKNEREVKQKEQGSAVQPRESALQPRESAVQPRKSAVQPRESAAPRGRENGSTIDESATQDYSDEGNYIIKIYFMPTT